MRFAPPRDEHMKGLVRVSREQLRYGGQLARAPFITWAESPRGRQMLERLALRVRLAPFGRVHAARGRLWRQLARDACSEVVVTNAQRQLDAYLPSLQTIAYAPDLPRVGVEFRRLVAVPRLLVNAEMYRRLDQALQHHSGFEVDGDSTVLRDWFILTLIDDVEAAIAAERPSPWRPLPAGDNWIAVGVNEQFEWRIPFAGHSWPGHFYLLELRRISITRAVRKAACDEIARLDDAIGSLSGLQRTTILRTAAETLQPPEPRPRNRTGQGLRP